ncbi:hypothetical protein [Cellulosimicrobium protaetiae]|uniref:Transcriptional regulator, AbiEi antitoxin, Type IV TA system n=1 Tax=Cellulosimicrobium protaetiae TaxID=2587808 RepID=A0A6M5UF39_9MICO|nr:hypothetical protein [Cellulosimicrobium protaetiae]QJW35875.1 hypothetical protein FIC82_006360 [Cellulosimicrobium protaetiae]
MSRREPEPALHLAREHLPEEVRRRLADGEWERLRRGAYRDAPPPDRPPAAAARALVVARARAVAHALRADPVVSHASAALLHGLPLWTLPTTTHVVQSYRRSGSAARDVTRHVAEVGVEDRATVLGVTTTSLARTVADCLRTMPALDALVVADAALARGLRRSDVEDVLDRRPRGRGSRRSRYVLGLADPGAESARETWLRYVLVRTGLPRPETQVPLRTEVGGVRVDLGWTRWRLLLEFDGLVKYRTGPSGLAPREDPGRVLVQEKLRQEAIERTGNRLLRVTSRDRPSHVVARVVRHVPSDVVRGLRPDPFLPPL